MITVTIELDDAAWRWLADAGYDPVYGARPLKRVNQRSLPNALATMNLEGLVSDGDEVTVSVRDGGLAINDRLVAAA